ncbi:MAG: class I SAM-dependent methyltransferase [Gammaproteobacteria bacterium]|nr:class I SAM-dependent methyltransferase [Gammaproteobacteria bacterium]
MTRRSRKKTGRRTLAERSDRHVLYERTVQDAEAEIDLIDATFTALRGRRAERLREDFCGTANTACAWVRRRGGNFAWAVDLDPHVLDWSRTHKLTQLAPRQRQRLRLLNLDVMRVRTRPVDIVLALNFSYWVFRDRSTMKKYFRRVYAGLAPDGVLFLDAFGGYEAYQEMKENTAHGTFTYIWDQARFNPVNSEITCHIHFRFRDGSRLDNAFTYHWRLWTLPELTEMLEESGFRATVYWEGTDRNGEGDGNFTPAAEGEADAGWIAYVVAEKE